MAGFCRISRSDWHERSAPPDTGRDRAAIPRSDGAALVASAKGRYRSAKKTYERFDCSASEIYCYGTLHGELLDGTPYSGIRFIDRFTVRDGKLVDQQVWNDMAEVLGSKLKPL